MPAAGILRSEELPAFPLPFERISFSIEKDTDRTARPFFNLSTSSICSFVSGHEDGRAVASHAAAASVKEILLFEKGL
jgi:hypothetical protein